MKKIVILSVLIACILALSIFLFFLQKQSDYSSETVTAPARQAVNPTKDRTLPDSTPEELPEDHHLDARKAEIALSNFDVRKNLGISEASELTKDVLLAALQNENLLEHRLRLLLFAAYLLEPDEARSLVMDFVTRDENISESTLLYRGIWGDKAWAIASLGIIGDQTSREILLKATTLEGAKELMKNWSVLKSPRFESSHSYNLALLRSSAVEGLAFANFPEDREFIMGVYEQLSAIENTEGEAARNALIAQEEEELIGYNMVVAARAYLDIIDEIGRDAFIDSFLGSKEGFQDELFGRIVQNMRD